MSEPYIGEIRMVGFNFAPQNWAFCDGSLIAISQNDTLFNLIGTTYGGDGVNTFALPDLRGRVPLHMKSGYPQGLPGGTETVTLNTTQLPSHSHLPQAATGATGTPANTPQNNYWAGWTGGQYSNVAPLAPMSGVAVSLGGNSQPHENMMPFLTINFVISLYGIYPTQ